MKTKILEILKENKEGFISGEYISDELGITRAGVWKHINKLKEEGYIIESISRKGYKLISSPDILSYEEIKEYLKTKFIGKDIKYFKSIDSTNKKAKEEAMDLKEGTVIIAEEQRKGKGRIGRDWISPKEKGIWMSIVLKPDLDPTKVSKITLIGAVSIFNALKKIHINSQIKWPNDILINGKKLAGILTEMSGELNRIDYIVMGIGINLNSNIDDFPDTLKDKATSLKIETGKEVDRRKLTAYILNEFEKVYNEFKKNGDIKDIIQILRENSTLIGREIKVINGKDVKIGRALDINEAGELVVEFEDGIENIISGEVSVRNMDENI